MAEEILDAILRLRAERELPPPVVTFRDRFWFSCVPLTLPLPRPLAHGATMALNAGFTAPIVM